MGRVLARLKNKWAVVTRHSKKWAAVTRHSKISLILAPGVAAARVADFPAFMPVFRAVPHQKHLHLLAARGGPLLDGSGKQFQVVQAVLSRCRYVCCIHGVVREKPE